MSHARTRNFAVATAAGLLALVGPAVAVTTGAVASTTVDCEGSGNVINGTSGNNVINGTPGNDVIDGRGGNDTIDGRGGNDVILGSGGNDVLKGGYGNDCLDGGSGDDRADGGYGDDTVKGGTGDDYVGGGPGRDRIDGGDDFDHWVRKMPRDQNDSRAADGALTTGPAIGSGHVLRRARWLRRAGAAVVRSRRSSAREQCTGLDPGPVGGQMLERQAGIEVRQPSPGREHRHVERNAFSGRPSADAVAHAARWRGTARTATPARRGPTTRHPRPHVTGTEVVAAEELCELGERQPVERPHGLVVERAGRHPDAGRRGAEAEAAQLGAQGVRRLALGLGHGEDDHQPAVVRRRAWTREDALVAFAQDLQGVRARARTRPDRRR